MLETEAAGAPPAGNGAAGAPPYLSLVIPAYNEERRLGPTLARVFAYFAERPYTTEVIVVSDGSQDGTARVAQEAIDRLAPDGRVHGAFYEYQPNAGKGRAVRTGVAYTRGRFVGFTDADLSTPVEEVDRALSYLRGGTGPDAGASPYLVVIGSRAAAGAEIDRLQPLYRRLSAKFFNVLRDTIVGLRGLRDTQCGLKVFEGDLARFIFAQQRIDGFMFDVETMYIAQRLRLPILELGVRWADAPESKVRLSSGLRLLPDLTRIRLMHFHLSPAALPAGLAAAERPA
ncbi:MAG TPA: dolichyl-phosphate beta-glucosyltransferase [Chloroflexota bacterium]|nr:dolichyl-phosphate beta-glucosyltransferase [Chloroflexota bacterium]